MYLLLIMNFIFTCCVGVFFYNQIKEKEDEIEELYDLLYDHFKQDENSEKNKKKGKIYYYDINDF